MMTVGERLDRAQALIAVAGEIVSDSSDPRDLAMAADDLRAAAAHLDEIRRHATGWARCPRCKCHHEIHCGTSRRYGTSRR